jgi:hypothetical protein
MLSYTKDSMIPWLFFSVLIVASTLSSAQTPTFHTFKKGPLYFLKAALFVGTTTTENLRGGISQTFAGEGPFCGSTTNLLAPKAKVDRVSDQENPLYNKQISLMKPFGGGETIAAVTRDNPTKIYIRNPTKLDEQEPIITVPDLPDATGTPTAEIVAFEYLMTTTSDIAAPYLIAAVKQSSGMFGDPTSGLVLCRYGTYQKDAEGKTIPVDVSWHILATPAEQPCAVPFQAPFAGISINDGLSHLESDSVVLYWAPDLERLFIGVTALSTDTADENQGVCALALGRIEHEKIHIDPILPHNIHGAEGIISARGPHKRVAVHRMVHMMTSTGSSYLIMVGGQGSEHETQRTVYALPVVISGAQESTSPEQIRSIIAHNTDHCTIAKSNNQPYVVFHKYKQIKNVYARILSEPLRNSDAPYKPSDPAVAVGGGPLPGAVTDLKIQEDAIFVSVAGDGENAGGLFYSQAVLDSQGLIVSWTPWQRYARIDKNIFGFQLFPDSGIVSYLAEDPQQRDMLLLKQTIWQGIVPADKQQETTTTEDQLQNVLSSIVQEFPTHQGGILHVDEHYDTDPDHSLIMVSGNKKIALLWQAEHQWQSIVLADAITQQLGPISCAAIISNQQEKLLVIGGVYGVAALIDNAGHGWKRDSTMAQAVEQITSRSLHFTKIADWQFTKKICIDKKNIYLLTDTMLVRYTLSDDQTITFKNPVILAKSSTTGALFDCMIDGPLAVLATSKGLLRNESGSWIATTDRAPSWVPVSLAHTGSAHQIWCIPGIPYDNHHATLLYVLMDDPAHHQSMVFRVNTYVDYAKAVSEASVQSLVEDANNIVPFLSFNSSRSFFYTDGMNRIIVKPSCCGSSPGVYLIPVKDRPTACINQGLCRTIGAYAPGIHITQLMQSTLLGTLLIVGEFGIIFMH